MKTTALILLATLLAGCVSLTRGDKEATQRFTTRLRDAQGVYSNQSEPAGVSLANVLFQRLNGSDVACDRVRLIVSQNDTIVIQALSVGAIVEEHTYRKGKDFEIRNAGVRVAGASFHENDSFIGWSKVSGSWSGDVCLDVSGDMLFRKEVSRVGVGGYGWIVIPFATHEKDTYRFRRLKESL